LSSSAKLTSDVMCSESGWTSSFHSPAAIPYAVTIPHSHCYNPIVPCMTHKQSQAGTMTIPIIVKMVRSSNLDPCSKWQLCPWLVSCPFNNIYSLLYCQPPDPPQTSPNQQIIGLQIQKHSTWPSWSTPVCIIFMTSIVLLSYSITHTLKLAWLHSKPSFTMHSLSSICSCQNRRSTRSNTGSTNFGYFTMF
jgi:hypothetical protein